jgi:hypothetical protein
MYTLMCAHVPILQAFLEYLVVALFAFRPSNHCLRGAKQRERERERESERVCVWCVWGVRGGGGSSIVARKRSMMRAASSEGAHNLGCRCGCSLRNRETQLTFASGGSWKSRMVLSSENYWRLFDESFVNMCIMIRDN